MNKIRTYKILLIIEACIIAVLLLIIIINSIKPDSSSNLDRDNYAGTTTAATYSPVTEAATTTAKAEVKDNTQSTTLITEKDIWGLWEYNKYDERRTVRFYSDGTMAGRMPASPIGYGDKGEWKYLEHEQVIKGTYNHKNELYNNIQEMGFVYSVEIDGEDIIIHYGNNEDEIMTKVE